MNSDGGGRMPLPALVCQPLPYFTAGLPGIGGRIKVQPEDFQVEEIPAYEPSGEGEHLFLWIEKTDVAAADLQRRLVRTLDVQPGEVGMAGLKDRRAVTRQYVSVPARCEALVPNVDAPGIRVLRAARHGNKLRTAHARGNRFSILVRDVAADAAENARRIAAAIQIRGFPNFYGSQRFGREEETLQLGIELLGGSRRLRSIPWRERAFLPRMALSAVQSALFNAVLSERLRDGLLAAVLPGDVMQVTSSGGLFVVADAAAEQARFDRGETVLTGPMFGPKMIAPAGEPALREARVLSGCGLGAEDFERLPKLTSGTRRPLLSRPHNLALTHESGGLRIEFELDGGVYATTLLREFMKSL